MNRSTNKIIFVQTTRSPAPESLNHVNGKYLDQRTVTAAFLKSAFMNNFFIHIKTQSLCFFVLFCFVFVLLFIFFIYPSALKSDFSHNQFYPNQFVFSIIFKGVMKDQS